MKKLLTTGAIWLALTTSGLSGTGGTHWGYSGTVAPEYWGELDPAYRLCKTGKNQSPIDINEDNTVKACLKPIKFSYANDAKSIVNNGHTVKVKSKGKSYILVDGKKFTLRQFHFHAPSEHTLNGEHFPFEAHFVHTDEKGNIAVVGVFFKVGKENPEIAKLWSSLPSTVNQEALLKEEINFKNLLPKKKDYYRYSGSLTTPPCSEGVRWFVLKEPVELSQKQLEEFKRVMGVNNNRPVQPVNARKVLK